MSEIIYEDNHILVAIKPQNTLTQSDITGDESFQDELKRYIKEKYQKPGEVYLGLVHRMDRPVGGLIVFARTSKAASRLSEQLRLHAMGREYLAVVENGDTIPDEGELCSFLQKDDQSGDVHVVTAGTNDAQEARLNYQVLERHENTALLHVTLQTGRKHQIRVQLAHAGHAIVFDMRYGHGQRGQSIALWGAVLKLSHPTQKLPMTFVSTPRGAAFVTYATPIESFLKSKQEE